MKWNNKQDSNNNNDIDDDDDVDDKHQRHAVDILKRQKELCELMKLKKQNILRDLIGV